MTILAILFTLSTASTGFDFSHLDCEKAFTNPEINECARRDHEVVEAKLNKSYQDTLAKLTGDADAFEAKKQLVSAQREWIKFRKLDCQAKFTLNRGGTIRTLVYYDCMDNHANQRIAQLENWADL